MTQTTVEEVTEEACPPRAITVTTQILREGSRRFSHRLPPTATLLDVLQAGAAKARVDLLPSMEEPLDHLRNSRRKQGFGPPIEDLNEELSEYLEKHGTTRRFGIELVLAICVNTRWAVATSCSMTPREILALPGIGLDYTQYTLYLGDDPNLLPLDTPIELERGLCFEAQKDGKYGEGDCPPHVASAAARLTQEGTPVRPLQIGGQWYALVERLPAPSPPWGRSGYRILVAVPYDEAGALDAFYLEEPHSFGGAQHRRVNGQSITADGATWKLVSWHYAEGYAWRPGQDDLGSHIAFCRGFFLARGARNAAN